MRGIGEKSIGLFNEPRGEEPRDEKSRDEEPGKRSRRTRNRGTRSKETRSRGARDQGIGAKGRGAVGREAGHAEFKKQERGLGFQRPKAQRRRKVFGGGCTWYISYLISGVKRPRVEQESRSGRCRRAS